MTTLNTSKNAKVTPARRIHRWPTKRAGGGGYGGPGGGGVTPGDASSDGEGAPSTRDKRSVVVSQRLGRGSRNERVHDWSGGTRRSANRADVHEGAVVGQNVRHEQERTRKSSCRAGRCRPQDGERRPRWFHRRGDHSGVQGGADLDPRFRQV